MIKSDKCVLALQTGSGLDTARGSTPLTRGNQRAEGKRFPPPILQSGSSPFCRTRISVRVLAGSFMVPFIRLTLSYEPEPWPGGFSNPHLPVFPWHFPEKATADWLE